MGFLNRLFRQPTTTAPDPFEVSTGRQITVDTARLLTLDRNTYWARLDRWQKLTLFDSIYHSQELATGAVNIITRFVNSRMIPKTDNRNGQYQSVILESGNRNVHPQSNPRGRGG